MVKAQVQNFLSQGIIVVILRNSKSLSHFCLPHLLQKISTRSLMYDETYIHELEGGGSFQKKTLMKIG